MQLVKTNDQAGGVIDRMTKQLIHLGEDVTDALTRAAAATDAYEQLRAALAPPAPDEIPLTLPQPPRSPHG